MRIILIGNLAEDRQESMRRFTEMLERGLRARGHEVRTILPRLRFGRLLPPYRYNGIPKFLGYIDKFIVFPWTLRRQIRAFQPQVVHITDQAGAIYGNASCGVPIVLTCHDLLQIRAARGEIKNHEIRSFGKRYQHWIASHLTKIKNVVSVSTRTRSDLIRLIGKPAGVSAVVPNGLHYPYKRIDLEVAKARLHTLFAKSAHTSDWATKFSGSFVLQIGGLHWYKNRDALIEIFAGLVTAIVPAPALIMVGPPLEPRHLARLAELNLTGRVVVIEDVSNEELEALYNLAEGLLFPSLEEGFGWPVAEAQACGCPVFSSNRSPMTEVGGTECVYFDPTDPQAATRLIAAAWPTKGERQSAAIAHARQWLPDRMLGEYEAVYRELIA